MSKYQENFQKDERSVIIHNPEYLTVNVGRAAYVDL